MFSIGERIESLIANPFSTPVGQRIERATSSSQQSEDWALNMEICDIINETDDGPKDAVKAIKKRIVGNKNFGEIMLALTVLEACVKNCGHRFQVLVSTQDFVEGVLVRTILPKHNPPAALHDRVLSLIQSWADAFRSTPSLGGVVYVYDDLRRRGLEFPMTDLDALSPIHTPNRSTPGSPEANSIAPSPQAPPPPAAPSPSPSALPPASPSQGPASLSPEQEQKLRNELALVNGNLNVMSEMLNEMTPGQSRQDDVELLQELYSVCKNMQSRVVDLIPQLADEAFIADLLVLNDNLNNAFIRYERFERLNKAQTGTTEQQSPPSNLGLTDVRGSSPQPVSQPAVVTTTSQPTLSAYSSQLRAAGHGVTAEEQDFDMFAQTRGGSSLADQRKSVRYEDPGAVEGLAGALDTRLHVTGGVQTSEQENLDRWLPENETTRGQPAVSEGVSSEEFEKFLDERAKEADQSSQTPRPTLPVTHRSATQTSRQQERSQDQLFSL